MKIIDVLQNPHYRQKNIIEKLICYKLNLSKEALFTDFDTEISDADLSRIKNSYDEYTIQKKPLEYILGFVEFLWVRFIVSPDTLIPRPETEYMIQAVGEMLDKTYRINASPKEKTIIIDVGTGCGVLGLSTIRHSAQYIQQVYLTEFSVGALAVAKKNFEILGKENETFTTPVTYLEADLVDHPTLTSLFQSETPIVLVANLPYIPDQTFDENVEDNVKKREPRMAFVGGNDGLDLYRRMFDQILEAQAIKGISDMLLSWGNLSEGVSMLDAGSLMNMLSSSSADLTMFLEMMTRQVDILRQEYQKAFTFEEVKTFHFNIRIVKVVPVK